MNTLQSTIEEAYKKIQVINDETIASETKAAIVEAIALIDKGKLRVAEKQGNRWVVHQWLKQAILLSFRISSNHMFDAGYTHYFDKIPLKYAEFTTQQFQDQQLRIVPNACIRKGAFIAKNTILR